MPSFRSPDFNERAELSRQAKQKALDKLRAKPAPTEAELAERKAEQQRKDEAQAEKLRARQEAAEQAVRDKEDQARNAVTQAAEAAEASVLSEADKKARRDARYAARKNRK